jgi:hypothetical protein
MLQPAGFTRVVHVHAGVQSHEVPSPEQPFQVVGGEARGESLSPGHDPRLVDEERLEA